MPGSGVRCGGLGRAALQGPQGQPEKEYQGGGKDGTQHGRHPKGGRQNVENGAATVLMITYLI
ncbi:hypothetical protein AZSP09_33050 [Azospira sp. I09]|nr:hypothetical protein AZSP09_33050 [Azospira sp. I09]